MKSSLSRILQSMLEFSSHPAPAGEKRSLPGPQKYLLITLLIGYPLASVLLNLIGSADPSGLDSRIRQVYLPSLMVQLLILSAILIILRRTHSSISEIGLAGNDVTWANALSGILFFVGAWIVIIFLRSIIEKSGYIPEKEFLYLLPSTATEKAFWVILSLGAAFSEEITFRGFIISRFSILTGKEWHGAVLSSLAFSLGHLYQGATGLILTFIYGLMFAGLYVARRSIFPCIVAHFLQDVLILFALGDW